MEQKRRLIKKTRELFTDQLEKEIWERYPFLTTTDSDKLRKFEKGQDKYYAFQAVTDNTHLLQHVLITSLKRAMDPEDLAFCIHGCNKHHTFPEAIYRLINSVEKGKYTLELDIPESQIRSLVVPNTRYSLTENSGRAFASFLDLQTVAHGFVRQKPGWNWDWRTRSRHIARKYKPFSTTKVLTAFMKRY